jgi:transcription initiation factor TFIIIB Brf1 subunit/transcription initiation factor TFIIB
LKCPICSGTAVSPDGIKGEKVCDTCGLVIDNIPNVRGFKHWNLEWHSTWSPEEPQTLKEWLTTIRTVACQLKIPRFPFQEEAALKIRKAKQTFYRSQKFAKNKRETIAALLHLVLNEYNKIRPIDEICKELNLDTKSVLKQLWLLKTINNNKELLKLRRKTSRDYLLQIANKVTNNAEILSLAEGTLEKIGNKGGNPISLAAGALYYASKKIANPLSKDQISKAFHISSRTVDTNERRIRKLLKVIANREILTKPDLITVKIKNIIGS